MIFHEKYFQGIYLYLTTLNVTNVPYSIVTKVTNVTNFCNNCQARARDGVCYVSRGIVTKCQSVFTVYVSICVFVGLLIPPKRRLQMS